MKRENAYFTVEAALVFPLAMSVMLFIAYMLLFQYNRCLMEQDLGAMAMWGSSVKAADAEALEQMARQRMAEMYLDKYAAWDFSTLDAALEKDCFSVKGIGQLTFPVPGWNFWSAGNVWSAEADFRCDRLSPVAFIRLCNKLGDLINQ